MKTIIEPFKIKSVEPIRFATVQQREESLRRGHYNLFLVPADEVLIDLLTDSGTAAMSADQWAGIMRGEEAYAGGRSFYRFEGKVRELTGLQAHHPHPPGTRRRTHPLLHRRRTRQAGARTTPISTPRGRTSSSPAPRPSICPWPRAPIRDRIADFKGNLDTAALEEFIARVGAENIPLVHDHGDEQLRRRPAGHPWQTSARTKDICRRHGIPLFLDACRFAENAYFIKLREPGYADRSVRSIVQEMFSYADGATMSAKKDAIVNIGGFLAMQRRRPGRQGPQPA